MGDRHAAALAGATSWERRRWTPSCPRDSLPLASSLVLAPLRWDGTPCGRARRAGGGHVGHSSHPIRAHSTGLVFLGFLARCFLRLPMPWGAEAL